MLINGHFDADPLRNEVTDRQTGKISRVEPRLMKLLCLLADNAGKPVSRKMIIKEIWNDYPGGDEGLTQAISVLRKLLNDDKKAIIETLPKTGYCFHGSIGADQIVVKRKPIKVIFLSAASFLLLVIALLWGYYNNRANEKVIRGKLSHEESVKAFQMDSKGRLASKERRKAIKPDSAGKLDSKER